MKESSQTTERSIKREQFESDFRWLMASERGRRLMLKLLSDMGMFRCTYDPGLKDNALTMAFREGQKNLGYKVMSRINELCPEQYFLMIKEGQKNG